MLELRKASRRRTLKGAIATYLNNFSTLDCQVRDISDTGCRLRSDRADTFPDKFTLTIELDGLAADCRVVWRKNADLGIQFEGEMRKVEPTRYQSVKAVVPSAFVVAKPLLQS